MSEVGERLEEDEFGDVAAPPEATLRTVATDADAARFVARAHELDIAQNLLDEATPSRVLYVHGPGGIGKSALLRAIGRKAAAMGFAVVPISTSPTIAKGLGLDQLLEDIAEPALVVVDDVDELGPGLASLRDMLLDRLSHSSRLVVAGRRAPDPTWRSHGLDAIVRTVPLGPLGPDDARRLLERHGVVEEHLAGIVAWAEGSPLALTVAALAPGSPTGTPVARELEARLTTWVTGRPVLDVPAEVLEVAALAPVVDGRLLAAALPSRPTRGAMAQLLALPVVEQLGDRAVLHQVLAAAIRTRLERTAPEQCRDLTRRIVEHLGTRARLGDIGALVELSQFVEDPAMRQAISNRPSPTLFTEPIGPEELVDVGRAQGIGDGPDWAELRDLITLDAPHRLVVRRADRSVVLAGAFGRAEAFAVRGPVAASLRSAVASSGADPVRTFVGVVWFAEAPDQERADAARLGTGALMLLHGVADMQAVVIHYPPPDRRPIEALAVIALPMPGDRPRDVALSDFRPHGAAGFVEAVVLAELGAAPRSAEHARLLGVDDDPHRKVALLARLDAVFDGSPDDVRLRQVIELAHLGPRPSEQECLDRMHVSRRTWYRLLRTARERVVDPAR